MTAKKIALISLKGSPKTWAIKDAATLEEALEFAAVVLYDDGELNPHVPAFEQLEATWGYLFDLPDTLDLVAPRAFEVDDEPDAPEAPVHLSNEEAAAWQSGWSSGHKKGREQDGQRG